MTRETVDPGGVAQSPETPRPERIAAIARALGSELSERVALYADNIADALARERELVAWDREQLIGTIQQRLVALRDERFREYGGPPVRVVERRSQPLESIEVAWRELRQGRRVRLDHEPGACTAAIDLLGGMAHVVGPELLQVCREPWAEVPAPPERSEGRTARPAERAGGSTPGRLSRAALEVTEDPRSWPVVGVYRPGPRVAVIEADADRELAAYVLARTSLRRTGTDPRATKRTYVVGTIDRLQRHLQRLWLGANLGPAADADSFAGPIDASTRDAFIEACRAWKQHEGVDIWVPGGVLERTGDPGIYLAPALVSCQWPPPSLPMAGPMLAVVRCTPDQARAAADQTTRDEGQVVQIGGRPRTYSGNVRLIRGALLVERLPPGLPEPRPV